MEQLKYFFQPQYNEQKGKLLEFLSQFQDPSISYDQYHQKYKYMIQLQEISNGDRTNLEVLLEDLDDFLRRESDTPLFQQILKNTKRYVNLLQEAAEQLMPVPTKQPTLSEKYQQFDQILFQQRIEHNLQNQSQTNTQNQLPPTLRRNFEVFLISGPNYKKKLTALRALKADKVGSLIMVKCIVVRTTEVKPLIQVAAYVCDACGFESYQTVNHSYYNPLVDCPSDKCKQNQTRGKLTPHINNSKFLSFQEIKIQETSDQCPAGNTPRMFNCYAYGDNTRTCSPGDLVLIQGVLCPKFHNERGIQMKNMDVYIESFKITREKKKYQDLSVQYFIQLAPQIEEHIRQEQMNTPFHDLFNLLAGSIAPEIFGMEDVKKALLLQMVSGTSMNGHDGMKIRGDINIALIGDPGVAKSQLLKYISMVSPRGVYTTGKGSSGVGLTAAVIRDQVTNELCLEGGALVLSDMGVCCIDEFDKMDERDRTSIHEVMEQQTVSIAKAGITTTLNARTSVLAAANPVYGRYNLKLSPHQNINLPASLLSRFDLIFLLLDNPNKNMDELLARHVGFVHKNKKHPETLKKTFSIDFLRSYISLAKEFSPTIPQSTSDYISNKYIEMRNESKSIANSGKNYTTPRTLLGIVRLSQGIAKLRFDNEVNQTDVDEALRLMEKSQESVNEDQENTIKFSNPFYLDPEQDKVSQIYAIIKEMGKQANQEINLVDIERKILSRGFLKGDLDKVIQTYTQLNVLFVNEKKQTLVIVQD